MSLSRLHQWVKSHLAIGGKSRRAERRSGAVHSAAGLRSSVRPRLEQLEDRLTPSTTTGPAVAVYAPGTHGDDHPYYLSSYAGVGFQNNVLAVVVGGSNGTADLNPNDYTAEINYDDGTGWQAGTVTAEQGTSGTVLVVKGSDVYGQSAVGLHSIQVQVSYQGTSTSQTQTAWESVSNTPSGIAGTQPPAPNPPSSTQAAENVVFAVDAPGSLKDTHSSSLTGYAGATLQNAVVGVVQGQVNGTLDTTPSDYQAWIDWGDGSGWEQAQVLPNTGSSTTPFLVQGSHTYNQTGTYLVTTYVVGPDGSTESNETAEVKVTANPNPSAPVIATNPANQTVTAGQTATLTASANATPNPTVQWQVSTDGGKTFTNISGATGTTLTLSNVTATMNGNEYQAVFTNSNGTATTTPATLNVTSLALSPGTGSLPNGTVGTNYNISITASGGSTPSSTPSSSPSSSPSSTPSGKSNTLTTTYTITGGTMPAGLTISSNNGIVTISGTPTGTGTVSFQVTASDSAGDPPLTQTYTLTVNPSPAASSPAPTPTPTPAPTTLPSPTPTPSPSSTTVGSPLSAFNTSVVAQDAAMALQGLETNNILLLEEAGQSIMTLLTPLSTSAQDLALQAFFVDFYNDLL
jgi:hypothetical protein